MSGFRSKVTMIALSAAAVGGMALAAPAHAADPVRLGQVSYRSTNFDDSLKWGHGWDACKAEYNNTKSIKRDGNYSSGTNGVPAWTTYWDCYSTPNTP